MLNLVVAQRSIISKVMGHCKFLDLKHANGALKCFNNLFFAKCNKILNTDT